MLLKEINERSSIRQYSDKKISEDDIKEILEAGRLAPSWMNVQPWHFIAVTKQETKEMLFQLTGGQRQILQASHVIIVLADVNAWNKDTFGKILSDNNRSPEVIDSILSNEKYYPKLRGEDILFLRTVEQCTYAVSYMTLQAQHLGINSCIIGALGNKLTNFNLQIEQEIKAKLKIPQNNHIITLITLGYKSNDVTPVIKKRKEFENVISKEIYDIKF